MVCLLSGIFASEGLGGASTTRTFISLISSVMDSARSWLAASSASFADRYSPTDGSSSSSAISSFIEFNESFMNLSIVFISWLYWALLSARSFSHARCCGFSRFLRYELMASPSMSKVPAKGTIPFMLPLSLIFIPVWRIIATRRLNVGSIINRRVRVPLVAGSSLSSSVKERAFSLSVNTR